MNQFKNALREVLTTRTTFKRRLEAGSQSLQKASEMRLALGPTPSIPAQQAAFNEYWHAANILHAGIIMSGMDAGEAVEDALSALEKTSAAAAALLPISKIKLADQRLRHASYRNCLSARADKVEAAAQAYREQVEADGLLLKAALPNFDEVAPFYEIVQEASII
jgi:hypothetical protein